MKRVSLTPLQAERVLEAIKSSKDDHLIGIASSIQSQLDRIGFTRPKSGDPGPVDLEKLFKF